MGLYLSALAFSLVLIGVSVFAGHDHGGEPGHDGPDTHGQGLSGLLGDVLSFRFVTWALGGFGLTGAGLTLLEVLPALRLPVSVALGLSVGWGTTFLFRSLRTLSASGPTSEASLLGHEAVVVLPLKPGALGKIRVHDDGRDLELLARGDELTALPADARVIIIRFDHEVAEVRLAPWTE